MCVLHNVCWEQTVVDASDLFQHTLQSHKSTSVLIICNHKQGLEMLNAKSKISVR